jgi:hypothetical protein
MGKSKGRRELGDLWDSIKRVSKRMFGGCGLD